MTVMSKKHQTQIKVTHDEIGLLYHALSNLHSGMTAHQWEARERLLKRLDRADDRV